MSDNGVRIVDCCWCDGSGRIELTPMPPPYEIHQTRVCSVCWGTGKQTVMAMPITLEDLSDER